MAKPISEHGKTKAQPLPTVIFFDTTIVLITALFKAVIEVLVTTLFIGLAVKDANALKIVNLINSVY